MKTLHDVMESLFDSDTNEDDVLRAGQLQSIGSKQEWKLWIKDALDYSLTRYKDGQIKDCGIIFCVSPEAGVVFLVMNKTKDMQSIAYSNYFNKLVSVQYEKHYSSTNLSDIMRWKSLIKSGNSKGFTFTGIYTFPCASDDSFYSELLQATPSLKRL